MVTDSTCLYSERFTFPCKVSPEQIRGLSSTGRDAPFDEVMPVRQAVDEVEDEKIMAGIRMYVVVSCYL
jgi:hypothetical protein